MCHRPVTVMKRLWNTRMGKDVQTIERLEGIVTAVALPTNGQVLVMASYDLAERSDYEV